ncbi:glycosyltransferase family 2 protein [Microbacterium keratanolyticum]|uniref:glycosyltransferase family 2 protein n=1 Tax=Microbacterium keratanolyticum TaxID=67574 RepID=UPI0036275FC4
MPDSAPIVTMIVPGRDIAPFAPAALDSLRAQTEPRWRALLVDDGSVDTTGEIFADAAARDPRFTLLSHRESRGLGAARNLALEHVDTPFLGFLDADDELTRDAIARTTQTLRETGSDFIAGAYVRSRWDGIAYRPGRVQPWTAAATAPERRATTLMQHPDASANIVAWSKVSRTEFWQDLRFPTGVAYEDQVVAQLMYTRARAFDVIPNVLVHWRLRADGSSLSQGKNQVAVLRDYLTALWGGIEVLRDAGATDAVRARLALILAMDAPPLLEIADTHPDPEYPALLQDFLTRLQTLPESADARPDPSLADALTW